MKKFFNILLILVLLIMLPACTDNTKNSSTNDLYTSIAEKKTFLVGVNENSKPFAYINKKTGKLEGVDVDLIKLLTREIFENDKIILKFVPVTPSNRILKLNSKEVDIIISTMTITAKRQRVVDFSKPYFVTGQALMVRKNSNVRSGKDLNYRTVGIVLGTTSASNIKYIASEATLAGFKNYKEAFQALQAGKVDAISADDVILQGIVSENNNYKILPDRYSTEFYGIAFRKDAESKMLKNKIDKAIKQAEQKGELINLQKKYKINN